MGELHTAVHPDVMNQPGKPVCCPAMSAQPAHRQITPLPAADHQPQMICCRAEGPVQ
jgi:hypothetical protein